MLKKRVVSTLLLLVSSVAAELPRTRRDHFMSVHRGFILPTV
jgi:hypothetical protein